jgi:hypothetical protein
MSIKRRHGVGLLVSICLGVLLTPWPASGQGGEAAGVITEIKIGRGRVEVKPAGTEVWRQAGPLQALRAGDAVRATENASVVILLSGERGSVKVEAARSPLVVPAPQAGETKLQKARALLQSSLSFLSASTKELPQAVLSTRGGPKPPVILTPRNGPVLPDSLIFEWHGSRFSRYTIRIVSPQGVVLERKGLTGARFDYSPDLPPLTPGVRYTFQVLSVGHPPQEAWFELLDLNRAQAIQRDLAGLEHALRPIVSPNSLAALRVGVLAREGLIHDARLSLTSALTRDPDEPTLHLLLGNLYLKAGLPDLAAESYQEAQFLLTRAPSEAPPVKR